MINLLENKLMSMMAVGEIEYYSIIIHCHSTEIQNYRVSTMVNDDTWIIYDDDSADLPDEVDNGFTRIHRPLADLMGVKG